VTAGSIFLYKFGVVLVSVPSNIALPADTYFYVSVLIGAGDGDAATGTGFGAETGFANNSSTDIAGRFGGSAGFTTCLAFSSGGHSIAFDGRLIKFFGFVLMVFFILLDSGNCFSLAVLLPALRPPELRLSLYGVGAFRFVLTLAPRASGAETFGGVYFG